MTSVAVDDSATAVGTNLDTLNSVAALKAITLNDGGTPTLTVSEATFIGGRTALGVIGNASFALDVTGVSVADLATVERDFGYLPNKTDAKLSISVSDFGSYIQTALGALDSDSNVTSIVISDNAALSLSAYDATNDGRAISLLQNESGLTVSDTAQNISTYLDQLNGESNVSSIVISDSAALTLEAYQVAEDTTALGKLSNFDTSGVTIDVSDTAANISLYLTALEANPDLSSITISDNGAITVSIDDLASDQDALGLLQNQNIYPVTLNVEDTAANIIADSAALAQNSEVSGVVISDNSPLTLSVSQYQSDSGRAFREAFQQGSSRLRGRHRRQCGQHFLRAGRFERRRPRRAHHGRWKWRRRR